MSLEQSRVTPIPIRTLLSAADIAASDPCNDACALSSFRVRHDDTDLQSQLVKFFKTRSRETASEPCRLAVTRAYARMLSDAASKWQPTAVVRILASDEMRVDPSRPHSLLANLFCEMTGAHDYSHRFFRTEIRRPMRMIDRLSGPEVLKQRIGYVIQDLFVLPVHIGGTVIILDDIYNLGASAAVCGGALKQLCGVERVYSLNLAATRFRGGKDRWGRLELNTDRFLSLAKDYIGAEDPKDSFDQVWIERQKESYHSRRDCSCISDHPYGSLVFLARRNRIPCPSCQPIRKSSVFARWFGVKSGNK